MPNHTTNLNNCVEELNEVFNNTEFSKQQIGTNRGVRKFIYFSVDIGLYIIINYRVFPQFDKFKNKDGVYRDYHGTIDEYHRLTAWLLIMICPIMYKHDVFNFKLPFIDMDITTEIEFHSYYVWAKNKLNYKM